MKRIDLLFDMERGIVGKSAEHRLAVRKELSASVLADLKDWMRAERRKLSRHSPVAKAMDYMLWLWDRFARFLDDGRICLSNNAAERALRGIALGRRSWLFAGSDRGGVRAAAMYTLIGTAKLNDVDPQAWGSPMSWAGSRRRRRAGWITSSPGTGSPSKSSIAPHRACPREGGGRIPLGASSRASAPRQTQPKIPCGPRRMLTSFP